MENEWKKFILDLRGAIKKLVRSKFIGNFICIFIGKQLLETGSNSLLDIAKEIGIFLAEKCKLSRDMM